MQEVGFAQFLAWLTGPSAGGFVLLATFAAVFLEDFAFWKTAAPSLKYGLFLIFGAALGVGAVALQAHPETVAAIDPFFRPVAYAVVAWLASQGVHEVGKLAARIGKSEG
jgi:hypothetical protein